MTKIKTHRFLLCDNPHLELEESGEFIYHSRNPRFLAKIHNLSPDDIISEKVPVGEHTEVYYNPDGLVEFHSFEIIDNIDNIDLQSNDFKGILNRLGEWYIRYLIKIDRNIKPFLHDFCKEYKGLKLIYSTYASKWLFIYKGKIVKFDNEPELDNYLETNNINLPDKGIINKL